ncbi:DUF523 domain-containing protein [Proteocatella sphenisci]|uniref:DUF523 domain-containing protein n=1 Tax=Proteocatella sphenisci TaxID=181070 RepID=UPI00048CFF66|nr:DUF523 domain-containing protein [Proteocatella sphenisci]
MDNIVHRKIRVGISACAYGAKTRYNRKGWDLVSEFGRDMSNFIWCPVCPEVMSGMGTPRTQIRIQGDSGRDVIEGRAKVITRNGVDVTADILSASNVCMDILKKSEIDAFIYMDGSPTCGVERTSLKNNKVGKPPGVFGAMLLNEDIFLIPALSLASPVRRWDYKRRLYAYVWAKNQEIKTKDELFKFWHNVKFLCQELDEKESRIMGKKIANSEFSPELAQELKIFVTALMKKPSTLEKIKNRLWKHYVYIKRKQGTEIEEIMAPQENRNMHHIAMELEALEKYAFTHDILFGSMPARNK